MDVEYIIHILKNSEYFVDHALKYHLEQYARSSEVLDRIGLDVFIISRFDMPVSWQYPCHRAGMWYDNHLEYSNRLN